MQKSTDGKLPNKRKFGIIPYLREKIRTQRECRIPQKRKKERRLPLVSKGVIMSFIEKEQLKEMIRENVKTLYRKTLEHATPEELYQAAVFAIRDVITDKWMKTHDEYYEKDVKVVY